MNQRKHLRGSLDGFQYDDLLGYFDISDEDVDENDEEEENQDLAELTPIKTSDTGRLGLELEKIRRNLSAESEDGTGPTRPAAILVVSETNFPPETIES